MVEFTVARNDIAEAVVNTVHGIPSNPIEPIRAGMHIKVDAKHVSFTAGDGDISFCTWIKADGSDGEFIVPGKIFTEAVKSLPDGDVKVSCDGGTVELTSGRARFTFRAIKGDYPYDGPSMPEFCGDVPGNDLMEAIAHVAPSTDAASATPAFTGILLDPEEDKITLAATDSYGIAACSARYSIIKPASPVLIPGWVLDRFRRGITSDFVKIGWDDNTCALQSGMYRMTSRLLAAEFPKWRGLFPQNITSVKIDPDALAAVVKRAKLAVVADAPVSLTFDHDMLLVEVGDTERFSESLDIDYQGEGYRCLVGSQLLMNGINGCEGDTTIGWTGGKKPIHLYSGQFQYTLVTRRAV